MKLPRRPHPVHESLPAFDAGDRAVPQCGRRQLYHTYFAPGSRQGQRSSWVPGRGESLLRAVRTRFRARRDVPTTSTWATGCTGAGPLPAHRTQVDPEGTGMRLPDSPGAAIYPGRSSCSPVAPTTAWPRATTEDVSSPVRAEVLEPLLGSAAVNTTPGVARRSARLQPTSLSAARSRPSSTDQR
jgi:hypothetical protein